MLKSSMHRIQSKTLWTPENRNKDYLK